MLEILGGRSERKGGRILEISLETGPEVLRLTALRYVSRILRPVLVEAAGFRG